MTNYTKAAELLAAYRTALDLRQEVEFGLHEWPRRADADAIKAQAAALTKYARRLRTEATRLMLEDTPAAGRKMLLEAERYTEDYRVTLWRAGESDAGPYVVHHASRNGTMLHEARFETLEAAQDYYHAVERS